MATYKLLKFVFRGYDAVLQLAGSNLAMDFQIRKVNVSTINVKTDLC